MNNKTSKLPSSFRDPSGFLFTYDQELYRQVNEGYKHSYDKLISSGLYKTLTQHNLLIPHEDVQITKPIGNDNYYKIIKPKQIEFISYPYEWSFSQLKDAALLTLKIQKLAIGKGMTLKDASSYNIQFHKGKPILIDTLSFDIYVEGKPWDAYRQFCQHFLAPLALMSKVDIRLSQLLRVYIDGIPLDLGSQLLPWSSKFNPGLLTHLHLHANAQKKFAQADEQKQQKHSVSKMGLLGLIDNLESTIKQLNWNPKGTEWADYYQITNYSSAAFENKRKIVKDFIDKSKGTVIWDLGGNTGEFSRAVLPENGLVISFDIDPAAVEKNYLRVKQSNEEGILPLLLDLTNPSSNIGWAGEERDSLMKRGPADVVMALALIHHICISNNVPLEDLAKYMQTLGKYLVIEFVPKEDSQVSILLSTRNDIFTEYHVEGFEKAFLQYFELEIKVPVDGSTRVLYLLKRKVN